MAKDWYVYLVRCIDNSLYCGVTVDLERRLQEHNDSAKGARYTRARRPVRLVYWQLCESRAQAQKQEARIKRLSKSAKEHLCCSVAGMAAPTPQTQSKG